MSFKREKLKFDILDHGYPRDISDAVLASTRRPSQQRCPLHGCCATSGQEGPDGRRPISSSGKRNPKSNFMVYRGFSKEEDSTLLHKLTTPDRFVYTFSGVRQSLYRFAGALCQLTVLFGLLKGRGLIHLFIPNLPSPALLPRCDWLKSCGGQWCELRT